MNRCVVTIAGLLTIFLLGCGQGDGQSPSRRNKPVLTKVRRSSKGAVSAKPSAAKRTGTRTGDTSALVQPEKPSVAVYLKRPFPLRFRTPGEVRYAMNFDQPVRDIHWSPLAGLSVSSGKEVTNVTSRGEKRWHTVAGVGHRALMADGAEVIWSRAFKVLFRVERRGRIGWRIPFSYEPFMVGGRLFLVDAATVAELGGNGKEKWRVNMEGMRKVDALNVCGDDLLFLASRGLERIGAAVSPGGRVIHQVDLPSGAELLGAARDCTPIVLADGEMRNLAWRGVPRWRSPMSSRPFFYKSTDGYMALVGDRDWTMVLLGLGWDGKVRFSSKLPISGRVASAHFFEGPKGAWVVGICQDVASPCARRDGGRGPFDVVLLGSVSKSQVLVRHVQGNVGVATFGDEGFVVASSSTHDRTDLSFRKFDGEVVWERTLPGRLVAGPYAGPYGGVYLGTCQGWRCHRPYLFWSVTAVIPPKEDDDGH